jgi:hypothetical protein
MSTREKIAQRRLDRMRLGQAVCDFVKLISDPEIRLAIVPLTEAEYLQALEAVAVIPGRDDLANAAMKDRRQSQEILVRSVREPEDLTERVYASVEEMTEDLDVRDIDELIDRYNEMVHTSSPSADGIPPSEFEALKKALNEMDMSALSGRAWYALKRFLSEVMPSPLLDNSPGFGSTKSLTTTKE